jgi:hypothetical protein
MRGQWKVKEEDLVINRTSESIVLLRKIQGELTTSFGEAFPLPSFFYRSVIPPYDPVHPHPSALYFMEEAARLPEQTERGFSSRSAKLSGLSEQRRKSLIFRRRLQRLLRLRQVSHRVSGLRQTNKG